MLPLHYATFVLSCALSFCGLEAVFGNSLYIRAEVKGYLHRSLLATTWLAASQKLALGLSGIPVARGLVAQSFGKHFCDKVRCNIKKAKVDINGIYNGKNKTRLYILT